MIGHFWPPRQRATTSPRNLSNLQPPGSPTLRNRYQAAGALVIANRTSKNQLTLPKVVVLRVGNADYYDV
ncbi:hypothetical protein LBMAG40_14590 [Cyanobium sp.]|nr:hypothetical protein LBMAG40_14590 [Cyanobium sp.]